MLRWCCARRRACWRCRTNTCRTQCCAKTLACTRSPVRRTSPAAWAHSCWLCAMVSTLHSKQSAGRPTPVETNTTIQKSPWSSWITSFQPGWWACGGRKPRSHRPHRCWHLVRLATYGIFIPHKGVDAYAVKSRMVRINRLGYQKVTLQHDPEEPLQLWTSANKIGG